MCYNIGMSGELFSFTQSSAVSSNKVSFHKEMYMNRFIAIVALVVAPIYFVLHFVMFLFSRGV
jgi:hypothetical protein